MENNLFVYLGNLKIVVQVSGFQNILVREY